MRNPSPSFPYAFHTFRLEDLELPVHTLHTLVVGSGAAGLQAADRLDALGVQPVGLMTEGMHMGTSRNTGSDKQTYYKLTLAGGEPDSVEDMARTLFDGGCVHGDVALVQAAQSARCFLRLCDIGVPFPQNRLGEYAGYQTDHDKRLRATSAGPLTSRFMTERLEAQVRRRNIRLFDRFLAIGIVTVPEETSSDAPVQRLEANADAADAPAQGRESHGRHQAPGEGFEGPATGVVGLLALDLSRAAEPGHGLTLFRCAHLVWATGGPAGIYRHSVYPESQTGSTGIALEAGAVAANLTESQYGIASTKFRWNLSGTYQQVLPRYVSTDADGGDAREFLQEGFPSAGQMLDAVFLKGYQWPFDPSKTQPGGSSRVDLLVGAELAKGRRVFLDFLHDPCPHFDFSLLGPEARAYLERSGALFGRPIDRLRHMNPPAIALYRQHGIDLETEWLEIAVCAQHSNGGLVGDIWWESNLRHFFPVGEVNGSFGVHRPGGSALNATQVGGMRAAERIAGHGRPAPVSLEAFLAAATPMVRDRLRDMCRLLSPDTPAQADKASGGARMSVEALRLCAGTRMSQMAGHIRSVDALDEALREAADWMDRFPEQLVCAHPFELADAFRLRDILLTRYAFLSALDAYVREGGGSRGSSLLVEMPILEETVATSRSLCDTFRETPPREETPDVPGLPAGALVRPDRPEMRKQIGEIRLMRTDGCLRSRHRWIPVRPVPERDNWFENVWRDYREGFPEKEERS